MRPILVTGVPRSGNTWLARLLALSPGTALAGREPMNPRGRQYALGGTLDGWARLTDPTSYQRFLLRTAYQGWNPFVFSRYGARQWAGPFPQTRVVVKDPYALLSLRTVVAATGATPVLVYRHPGAVLASYRRVAWGPRLDEVAAIVGSPEVRALGLDLPEVPECSTPVTARQMGIFWSVLMELALTDAPGTGTLVVSHTELATGGEVAGRVLADRLGLRWSPAMTAELTKESSGTAVPAGQLHHFDRAPSTFAEEWRDKLSDGEIQAVEQISAGTLTKLEAARLRLL
jgi:Sulfotransferase family